MNGIPESQMSEFAPDVIALIGTGAAKVIPLTQGKVAVVDAEDYEWLSRYKWHVFRPKDIFYAARHEYAGEPRTSLHREIMKLTKGDGKIIDHKNRNGLDNRKGNLRVASRSLNGHNCKLQSHNKSGFRGVFFNKRDKTFQAQIKYQKQKIHCGSYRDILSAAAAYDRAAIKYYGEGAVLNIPMGQGAYITGIPEEKL